MNQRIAVIGDAMLDERRWGSSARTSPEQPSCRVLADPQRALELGGAANVARWLAEQPGSRVTLFAHWALDTPGLELKMLCRGAGIELSDLWLRQGPDSRTTRKERVCLVDENRQQIEQLVRCDSDTHCILTRAELSLLQGALTGERFDAVVVADYHKGVFLGPAGGALREWIGGLPAVPHRPLIVVNSKRPGAWEYWPVDALICNEAEARRSWGAATGSQRWGDIEAHALLITQAAAGVSAHFGRSPGAPFRPLRSWPSRTHRVVDVTGAGDAFTAGFAWALLHGPPLPPDPAAFEAGVELGQLWAAACCAQVGCGQPIVTSPLAMRILCCEEPIQSADNQR